jgi:hypothetical protein
VSFGSLLKAASFPEHFTASLVRAFEALPYCVLWKYEGEMNSKRIKVSKWMPQQQILSKRIFFERATRVRCAVAKVLFFQYLKMGAKD